MRRLLAASVSIVLFYSSAVLAVEVETATGTVQIDKRPERIAVFDIAAIDTLSRLGVRIDGVPDNLFLPALEPVARQGMVVGTLFDPNLEALSELSPDLIILGERTSDEVASVERVASAIDMTMTGSEVIGTARKRLLSYGLLFGLTSEANALVQELDEAVERARAAVAGSGKALILMTSGSKITAYGTGSRFGWIYRELGIEPAVTASVEAKHGEAVSFEFLHAINPDWLIVVDRAAAIGSSEERAIATLDNELVRQTTAWKKRQLVFLPPAEFYIAAGGITSTVKVLDAISEAFVAGR